MHDPGYDIRLRSSARTNTGQVRQNNEDNIHLWARDNYVLAVVADGMGGAAAGEEASRIAVEAIESGMAMRNYTKSDTLHNTSDEVIQNRLIQTIQSANHKIMQKAADTPDMRGMGTTVTLAFIKQTHVIVAHVGDSRAYLVESEDHTIIQITADHSFVQALLTAGHITPEQAEEHPMRNVLYRALGQGEDVEVDIYIQDLHIGDRLILCSDGLTRHVKADEIATLVLAYDNPDTASQKLIDLANERGGEDNVSVIVIAVEQMRPTQPPQKEAVLFEMGDDDQTLVLKDRKPGTKPLPPLPDSDQIEDDDTPTARVVDDLVESSSSGYATTNPLHEERMAAERPSDDMQIEEYDPTLEGLDVDDPLDRAITTRPELLFPTPPSESDPPVPDSGNTEAEGVDSLIPDQQ
ncbi:MAG: Stp1/IreP family PP2C-type Ser/Thr phosphatase [Anaerolineae bacterium]|nr:Stp1/IreP family PP2C-type Ser/Thr phosphatase [Anaerolineae bacterium]